MIESGEWVICRDYSGNEEFRRYDKSQIFVDGYFKSVKLWKPKIGKWCWHKEKGLVKIIEQLDTNSYLCKLSFKVHYKGVVLSSDFEPFIGTLPSFIKE